MKRRLGCAIAAMVLVGEVGGLVAGENTLSEEEKKQGFVLMFNGEDLAGWKAQSEKHFRVEDGKLIVDGTKGRSILS